jgi:hypothetical protein
MKPWLHAKISAKKFGGVPEDYIDIHEFLDSSKAAHADMRHRAVLHNAFGIYLAAQVFGTMEQQSDGSWKRMPYIRNSAGELVQVRDVAEQHVLDDLGKIPSVGDYLQHMTLEPWMGGPIRKRKVGTLQEFLNNRSEGTKGFLDGSATRLNGGQLCDTDDGQCACGAWHSKDVVD